MIARRRPPMENLEPFKDRPDLITDPIFLIGNGKSRKDFDLERLRGIGTIIGCNALYREFAPDLLVIIDAKMLRELKSSTYTNTILVPAGRTVKIPEALTWRTKRFNTSGCFAMKVISEKICPTKCYMLGMDCYTGNMYDKTINYSQNTLQNFKGILKNYIISLEESKDTIFINVNDTDAWTEEAHETGKYQVVNYEEFEVLMAHWRNW